MTRLLAVVATLLWAVGLATGASAHASLVSVEPADGSVVAAAPEKMQLRFNEAVKPVTVSLIDAAGKSRDDVAIDAVDQTIVLNLPADLPRGTQLVSYRVISQDGHPVGGSVVFSIGAVTGAAVAPAPSGVTAVAALIWLARIGVYLGLFVGVGGMFFVTWIGEGRPEAVALIVATLCIGFLGAVASLGLQGLDVLNLPLSDLAIAAPWASALATSLGPSLLIAVAAMAIAGMAWKIGMTPTSRVLTAVAMASAGLSLATTGHAATAGPQWLTRTSLFLHGVGAAYWAGALAPLLAMARRQADTLPSVLHRFSAVAIPIVGLLVLTGLGLSVIQLESFRALVETSYGIILSIKLVLVAMLLALAALNRFRLTPAVASDCRNTRPLQASILLECLLMVGILALVAGWRFTPPPRALAAQTEIADRASAVQSPLAIHIHTDSAMFQVLVSPGAVGVNSFVLQLMNGDATPLVAKEVTLVLGLPERGIEPLERAATLGGDGYWHVGDVLLPYPGRWHVRIEALVTDFQKVTLEDEFDVPAR